MKRDTQRHRYRRRRTGMVVVLAVTFLFAAGTLLGQADTAFVGTVEKIDPTLVMVETETGDRTFEISADTLLPEDVTMGDAVIVEVGDAEDRTADSILKIHDRMLITERAVGEHRAVLGTVKSTGTDGLIVETELGGSTFVVRPEKLFPPVPQPGDKVGVIYRVQELAEEDRALANQIVLLPADFTLPSQVQVSHQRIPQEATDSGMQTAETMPPAEEVAPRPTVEEEPMKMEKSESMRTELPQTSGQLALLGLTGLVALSAGLGLGSLRRRTD